MMLSIDAITRYNEEQKVKELRSIRRNRVRTESNMSITSENSTSSMENLLKEEIENVRKNNIRNGREDSNWDLDDNYDRKIMTIEGKNKKHR